MRANMLTSLRGSFTSLLVFALAACSPPPPPDLAIGQTWTIHARPSDGATSVSLLHIEESPVGPVAFVSINNAVITLPDRRQVNKIWPIAIQLPALKQSLKKYQAQATVPLAFQDQVAAWREATAAGRTREVTFDVPVAEALDQFERGKTGPWRPRVR